MMSKTCRMIPFMVSLLLLCGCESMSPGGLGAALGAFGGGQGALTPETIAAGLKEALAVGTQNAVRSVAAPDAHLQNPALKIPLPEALEGMSTTLRRVGLGPQVDAFEAKMNEAARLAAAEAAPVFLDAIRDMSFADARQILAGGDHAATEYFREKTTAPLKARYLPIISQQMQSLGAVRTFQELVTRYNQIPLVPKQAFSIEDYVADRSLEGLFGALAAEEQRIRENPAARSTALLQRVFGSIAAQ